MSNIPKNLKYTKDHEWVLVEGEIATIGITDYAQSTLGEIVYVELPEVGDIITQEEEFGVVESVKSASDLFAPLSGDVTEINSSLEDSPEYANEEPYGKGWMMKIKMSDATELDNLLSAEAYNTLLENA